MSQLVLPSVFVKRLVASGALPKVEGIDWGIIDRFMVTDQGVLQGYRKHEKVGPELSLQPVTSDTTQASVLQETSA